MSTSVKSRTVTLADLASMSRWVAWRLEKKDPQKSDDDEDNWTKVPINPATGRKSRSNDAATWGTRTEAERRWKRMKPHERGGGIGIVLGDLGEGYHLLGIDLDSCIPEKGPYASWADEIIDKFKTYAEISPSGTGVKLFFRVRSEDFAELENLLKDPKTGEVKTRKPFTAGKHQEIALDTARFYAVTDKQVEDTRGDLRVVDVEEVRWLLKEAGPQYLKAHGKSEQASDSPRRPRDRSGSGYGCDFMQKKKRQGLSYEQARKALLADEGPAGEWANRVNERQHRNAYDFEPDKEEKVAEFVTMSGEKPEAIDWLWDNWLPRGEQIINTGLPFTGKSQQLMHATACITTGRDWPDGSPCKRGHVILVTGEDNVRKTLLPRLIAAGADLSRVHHLKLIRVDKKKRSFMLSEDLELIEKEIKRIKEETGEDVLMIGIDPITAYIGGKGDSHKTTDMRSILMPLSQLAQDYNVLVYTITHPAKSTQSAINSFIGSQAFIANARVGFLTVAEHVNGEATGRFLLTMVGTNIGKQETQAFAYVIEVVKVAQDHRDGRDVNAVRIVFASDRVTTTADDALNAGHHERQSPKLDEACDFLKEVLKGGPMLGGDIKQRAAAEDIKEGTLHRAYLRLQIVSRKEAFGSKETWALPGKGKLVYDAAKREQSEVEYFNKRFRARAP